VRGGTIEVPRGTQESDEGRVESWELYRKSRQLDQEGVGVGSGQVENNCTWPL
jgi:hypothetical protein